MEQRLSKEELKIASLKERFARRTADMEEEIADMRAEATLMLQQYQEENEALRRELDECRKRREGVSAEVE